MKKCDKHHGDIEYDEKIYLECPLCKKSEQADEAQQLLTTFEWKDSLEVFTSQVDELDSNLEEITRS